MFKADYSKNGENNGYSVLPKGWYEVIIEKAQMDATPGGTECFAVTYRIRDDVDQMLPETNGKYHKRLLFVNYFKSKKRPEEGYARIINSLLQAVDVPEGQEFQDEDDAGKATIHKPVRVYVDVDKHTYNGKTTERNQVAPWNVVQTKAPFLVNGQVPGAQTHNQSDMPDPFGTVGDSIQIDDDALPF